MSDDQRIAAKAEPHRQESQSFIRKGLVFGAAVLTSLLFIALMAGGITALHMRASAEKADETHPPVTVETAPFELIESYTEAFQYVGRLEPARQTALAFERAGLVLDVARDEGDIVAKHETVAALDIAQLQVSRAQLQAQIREFQARRRLAELTLERQQQLRSSGWSPDQRFDEATASVAELTASIERVEAQIGAIDIDIRKSILRAPFEGLVAERSIDEGAVVSAGMPVVTLLEAGRRQARIGLPPDEAVKLRPDQQYKLRSGSREFTGKLAAKRPDIQPGTRTATALFDVTGADDLAFGEIITLELETKVHERGGWLPLTALKEGARGLWTVMTVTSGKDGETLVRSEAVEVVYARDQRVYVRGTLQDGARVITNGGNRVINGQLIALAAE